MSETAWRLGWGTGWVEATEKLRLLLSNELSVLEAKLRLNRQDFDEDHPAVFYLLEHIASLRRLAADLDIFLPGEGWPS